MRSFPHSVNKVLKRLAHWPAPAAARQSGRTRESPEMRPADRLAAKLAAGGGVLLDGATGTELQRRGVPMDGEAWCALATLTDPDVLRAVHEDYVRLGCDVVTANTFANARHMMARAG